MLVSYMLYVGCHVIWKYDVWHVCHNIVYVSKICIYSNASRSELDSKV